MSRLSKLISLLMVITVLGIVAFFFVNSADTSPLGSSLEGKLVTIESGTTPADIGALLEEQELITGADNFTKYVSQNGLAAELKAGTYSISDSMTINEIAKIIASGQSASLDITILPGQSLIKLANKFEALGFSSSDVQSALYNLPEHPLLAKAGATSLEGYIFPETYRFDINTTVEQIVTTTLDELNSRITPEIEQGIEQQGLSLDEAVNLASLVQLEVGVDPPSMPSVAQVFLKRLEIGELLGSDVTFKYAAELLGQPSAINIDSPYNTRINAGLPPTAVANFTMQSLEAVAFPSDTDFLFFVSGDDGSTYFTNTLQEHEAKAAEVCIELCQIL